MNNKSFLFSINLANKIRIFTKHLFTKSTFFCNQTSFILICKLSQTRYFLQMSSRRCNKTNFLIFHHSLYYLSVFYYTYIAPSFFRTTATVFARIRKSSPILHSEMYFRSSFTTSSKSVMSLLPLTCHIPVIPGFMASLVRW